jgi:starch-binding outer membrane protein, SusD/RagB family
MKIYKILFLGSVLLFTAACEESFLDRKIDTSYTEKFVFGNYSRMRDFGMATYTFLPSIYNKDHLFMAAACDEAALADESSDIQLFGKGAWGPTKNPDNVWGHYYSGIKHANEFLERSSPYDSILALRDTITPSGKSDFIKYADDIHKIRAEVRFLRAYFYFELIRRYGGVPIIIEAVDLEADFEYSRNTFGECIEFISAECDTVFEILPHTWINYGIPQGERNGLGDCPGVSAYSDNIGRIIKAAPLALKVRSLLYNASPLHNPQNELARWEAVAEASDAYLKASQALYPGSSIRNVPGKLNDSYLALFRSVYQEGEIILERREGKINYFEKRQFPIGFQGGGTASICPTQNLVDAYGMSEPQFLLNPRAPYKNRDPRFYMSIVHNDAVYGGGGANFRAVESFVGGVDGLGKYNATTTGYYLRKHVDTSLDLLLGQTSNHTTILMRFSEILLNHAEAMNEIYGPYTKLEELYSAEEAINQIRSRPDVMVPEVPAGLSADQMRELIQNERRIELVFEGHRFFDIRRWKLLDDPLKAEAITKIYGTRIIKGDDGKYSYEKFLVKEVVFEPKMYLYPIPYSELMKGNGFLEQNPGW